MHSAIVVGAGLSGLTVAKELVRANWSVTILDSRSRIGGRVQTDSVEGFLLDHGFQVYLTGYETAGRELDVDALKLGSFAAGALIQYQGKRHRVCDPLRSPWYLAPIHALETLLAPVGSIADKVRIAAFRSRVCKANPEQLIDVRQSSARTRLEQMGFSEIIIQRFFRPFFGGIFLDESLSVSSGMMDFVFRTFSTGYAALPVEGMQAIPVQIASSIPSRNFLLNTTVQHVEEGCVVLSDHRRLIADRVVVATEEPAAKRILNRYLAGSDAEVSIGQAQSTSCLYFDVPNPPIRESMLVLNGDGSGIINNLCFPSFAQPSYAPAGRALLSVSTIGQTEQTGDELLRSVSEQLVEWFGPVANSWRHLKTYRIPYALPSQTVESLGQRTLALKITDKIYRCGDYFEMGSIEGAIKTGLNTARLLLG